MTFWRRGLGLRHDRDIEKAQLVRHRHGRLGSGRGIESGDRDAHRQLGARRAGGGAGGGADGVGEGHGERGALLRPDDWKVGDSPETIVSASIAHYAKSVVANRKRLSNTLAAQVPESGGERE